MADVYHPWQQLRTDWPDWQVVFARLPNGILAGVDAVRRAIFMDSRQLQAQRRSSITHELIHLERGHVGCQPGAVEEAVCAEAARRLIPLDALIDAIVWSANTAEACEELNVDLDTLRVRGAHIHPSERLAINAALAAREETA